MPSNQSQSYSPNSYFGNGRGSTPGYSQSAWNGGSGRNLGSGSAGLNANDGPGGFMSGMNGTWQEPSYQQDFQWGNVNAGGVPGVGGGMMGGTDTGAGSPVSGYSGGGSTAQLNGNTTPSPGSLGYGMNAGPGNAYGSQYGMADPAFLANYYQQQQQAQQPFQQAQNDWMANYQQQAGDRQAAQHQAFLDANPGWMPPQQSQLGSAMQSGMNTQQVGQQMGAPQGGLTAMEAVSASGYQPGNQPINQGSPVGSGSTPYALSPERYGRLPVDQLQQIASGRGSQLRPELQQQAAVMANDELARRGAAGNQQAVGNQQALDTAGQFMKGIGQGLGWMNPFDSGIEKSLNAQRGDGPFAPDLLDVTTPENIFQAVMNQRGTGGWSMPGQPTGTGVGGDTGMPTGMPPWMLPQSQPQGGMNTYPGANPSQVNLGGQPRPLGYPVPQTSSPIVGSQQPQGQTNPYPGTTQMIPFGQGLPPGISGSMAIGPNGQPYGGTPNLLPPEPQYRRSEPPLPPEPQQPPMYPDPFGQQQTGNQAVSDAGRSQVSRFWKNWQQHLENQAIVDAKRREMENRFSLN